MTKTTSRQYAKTLATGLALGALVATTGVSAAGVHILDDADTDYSGTYSVSNKTSTYDADNTRTVVIEEAEFDYTPYSFEDLEEAEFAAFEVPEDLKVHD